MLTLRHSPFERLERPGATGAARPNLVLPPKAGKPDLLHGGLGNSPASIADRSSFKPSDRSLVISAEARIPRTPATDSGDAQQGPEQRSKQAIPAKRVQLRPLEAQASVPRFRLSAPASRPVTSDVPALTAPSQSPKRHTP